jgi:hypothetical protein
MHQEIQKLTNQYTKSTFVGVYFQNMFSSCTPVFYANWSDGPCMSHPILQGKPNASHMCARIIYTHMIDKTRVIPLL